MKKKIISLVILLLLILSATIIWQAKNKPANTTELYALNNNVKDTAPSSIVQVNFKFDNDTTFSLQYPYSSADERTLNLLYLTEKLAQEQNWEFSTQNYDELGTLVTQIKDKVNGQEQKYWQYKINQKTPLVSANNYILQVGDVVDWEFRISEL